MGKPLNSEILKKDKGEYNKRIYGHLQAKMAALWTYKKNK
jgi:hypothetical protein